MSIEPDLLACLQGFAPLATRVADAIAQNAIPETAAAPYVVATFEHALEHNLLNEVVDDTATVTVECYGKSATEADEVADLVQAALSLAPATHYVSVEGRRNGYDPETQLDVTVLTVEWTDA